jgi:arginyl-tRNA synthetase
MNVEFILKESISRAFGDLFGSQLGVEEIKLQPTRKDFQGSHTFVTFPYTRISKKSPLETGEIIGNYLKEKSRILASFNVVNGFLNLEINDATWFRVFEINLENNPWSKINPSGRKVMIEYSSPNTNKPLHLGHLRNNFLGFSVAEILKAVGDDVMKVNLVNDRGIHICKSMLAYLKFGHHETPESSGIKGDHFIGKYYVRFDQEYKKQVDQLVRNGMQKEQAAHQAPLMLEAKEMLKKWEEKDPTTITLWEKMNGWVYEGFDRTYRDIGVDFDKIYHESDTYLIGKQVVLEGLEKGIFFRKEDGSVWVDLSEEGLDEKLLLRSDGTSVYITQDLGTADLKYRDFPFDLSIYVVGNEQDYHFEVLVKILKKLSRNYADRIQHLSYGMVDLPSGKMKSREGTVVDADDLVEEMLKTAQKQTEELGKIEEFNDEQARNLYRVLAMGALKYFLLKIDPRKRMLFNPDESIQFQGNTGPFIQYTYARISSILRKAREMQIDMDSSHIDWNWTLHETEKDLIITLSNYGDQLSEAAREHAPSTIANYCYDLAKSYNRFYTEDSILNEENIQRRNFRVSLSQLTARTIYHSMKLLGIEVPERM